MRLAGRLIVLTRPSGQNAPLAHRLEAEGAKVLEFPVTLIAPLADPSPLIELGPRLEEFDLAFFVSPNAVAQTFAILPPDKWPTGLALATVGPASAKALQIRGFKEVIVPKARFDTEGILELPDFQAERLSGRRVLILRGNGGRELLPETLKARGAKVECLTCYQRLCAKPDPAELSNSTPDGFVFSNSEAIGHFLEIMGPIGKKMLASSTLFAPHARILQTACDWGARHTMLTAAGDEGIVSGILETLGPRLG